MLLHKLGRLIVLICCLPLLGAAAPPKFQISGIEGNILLNVQRRLTELYQDKSIVPESAEALHLQIEKALYPYGYFKPDIEIAPGDISKRLNIHITPGPQLLITSLSIEITGKGANNYDIKKARQSLPIKAGQPLINTVYEDAKERLSSTAEKQGYLHASFEKSEVLIDRQLYTAQITLRFNTGPQYYFGQIRFDPTYISPDLLKRYLPFKAGQPYSSEQILTLNKNLSASGYFKTVNVNPLIQANPYVPIDVHLKRTKPTSYSLGLGYGTDTGPRGLVGLHVVPVNRYGHTFNAIAQGSFQENALQAQYIIPGLNPMTDKYSIGGGVTNLHYNSGRSNAYSLSLAQQHVLTNYQRLLSINGLNERYNYTGLNKTEESLVYPKAIFTWSNISDQLFSPSGYNVTINGLVAHKGLLSQISMAQAGIDIKAAINIEPIGTRVYFHGIQGVTQINNVDQIPLSLAQLLGSAGNLKGYSYNSLGPGKLITYGGVELQKETLKKWYLVGSLDSGDVYNPSLRAFKYDVGVGLMWVSPVGPIKIGVAQAVDHSLGRLEGHKPKFVVNMGPDL